MSLLSERGCPDCGEESVERALHQVGPTLCPRCRLARALATAARAKLSGQRFCPLCEVQIAAGSWGLHERSKYHRRMVRVHFAEVLDRQAAAGRNTA